VAFRRCPTNIAGRAQSLGSGEPTFERPDHAGSVCTRLQQLHARTQSHAGQNAAGPPLVRAHAKDIASAEKVYLIIRSEYRVMSHSANIGLERTSETDLCLSSNTSDASRFLAIGHSSSLHRGTLSHTKDGSISSIGRLNRASRSWSRTSGPTNRSWAR